jgi:hypothetical protein
MLVLPPVIVYRLIRSDQVRLEDFLSHEALGTPPRRRLSRRDRDRWSGVSHQSTLESAVDKANDSPWLGTFAAEVHIPHGAAVRIEQTGRDPCHYTVWADPADLLSWVVSVTPIHEVQ